MSNLDFKSLKAKLNQLQGQNNRMNSIFKPKKGETIIRIVPWIGNRNNPFIEMHFHYLGNKTYLSPLTHGNPDPIAEFADSLRSTGDKDDWTNAKQFTPKLRTYVPIVVRKEEEEGVKFWSFGKTVYQELLSFINDEDYGDITDPVNGRDIVVKFTPAKESDTGFAKTEIRIKPNVSPLSDNAATVKTLLSEQPNIEELYTAPTYDELKDVLQRFLTPSGSSVTESLKTPKVVAPQAEPEVEEADDAEAPAAVATAKKPTAKAKSAQVSDIESKFEDLFNDKV